MRLASRGWRVTSLERHASVAQDASGNPAGVFHPMISRDDSVASRVTRAGFLYTLGRWAALERLGHHPVRGAPGLLQIAADDEEARSMSEAIAAGDQDAVLKAIEAGTVGTFTGAVPPDQFFAMFLDDDYGNPQRQAYFGD